MKNKIKSITLNKKHLIVPGAGISLLDYDKFILCDLSSNAVYSYNVIEDTEKYLGGLVYKTTRYSTDLKCSMIIRKNDKLYFIPANSDYLNIFDFSTGLWEYYELPLIYNKSYKQYIYYAATIIDDYLIIFGYDSDCLIIFNTYTRAFEVNEKLYSLREKLKICCGEKFFVRGVASYKGSVYFVSLFKNSIFKLDFKKNELQQIELNGSNRGYVDILTYNDELWLIPYQGERFVKYLVTKDESIEYTVSDSKQEWTYSKGLIIGHYLYAVTCYGDRPVIIDLKQNKIKEWICLKKFIGENGACTEFIACDDYIYIYQYMKKRILRYSIKEKQIIVIKVYTEKVPEVDIKNTYLNEQYEAGLDNFIQCMIGLN